jgi:hypothetical protein
MKKPSLRGIRTPLTTNRKIFRAVVLIASFCFFAKVGSTARSWLRLSILAAETEFAEA